MFQDIKPVEYKFRPLRKRLAVFDSETDPFALDKITGKARRVEPFTCGFYDGERYVDFWGEDQRCIRDFFEYLNTRNDEEFLIAVHNGGNFDFYFMLDYMDAGSSPFIMDGRIVKMVCQGQEFRDSYKLIPVALSEYQKTEVDYAKFERGEREKHAAEIRAYQKDDCVFLYDLVKAAYDEFGDKLTMASVALPKLRSFHGFQSMGEQTDEAMRPFYFGGRCEAFEVGELKPEGSEEWIIVDKNSMYPDVMAKYLHPIGSVPKYEKRITEQTHFARIVATSRGALPTRQSDGSLAFPHGRGTYSACIHEIKAAQELGLLDIHEVEYSVSFDAETSFAEFVDHFYTRRLGAKAAGDKIRIIFWKLVLNSSYGKFAQDPRKYKEFLFDPDSFPAPEFCSSCAGVEDVFANGLCERCNSGESSPDGWRLHTQRNGRAIFARPQVRSRHSSFFNVATAASITSAARAELLRGFACAQRPIYCDTDSIICEAFPDALCDPSRLGAWKREASGDVAYIAGKKLYAVFDHGKEVKKASKGVKLTADQIARVAAGEVIEYAHKVPKFTLDGGFKTTERTIRRTIA